jgi:Major Facilitator Superfamily
MIKLKNREAAQSEVTLRLTPIQWLICVIAAIGFIFDTYEVLMLPLIIRPALETIGGMQFGSPAYNHWRDLFFYVPAVSSAIFGLLGGYLIDLFGRRRVLTWSILLYAFSAFAAGFATSLPILLFLRCTTFIGVSVEFVAAVAWLAELFPNPKQREAVLGYTQAFYSFGGVMVSGVAILIARNINSLPMIHGGHEQWRYLLISGLIPAIPLIVIRPFLPESPVWLEKKAAGTLRRPSFTQLFSPNLRKTTLVTTAMFACAQAAIIGGLQQIPQVVPGLPEVRNLPLPEQQAAAASVQSIQEIGGLVGRFLLAFLAIRIASRRNLIRIFQIPGLILIPLVFTFPAVSNLWWLKWGIFFAGMLTIAQLSFWGNYLPRVYPTHLRGTGESFPAFLGGRLVGASAALLVTQLAMVMPGSTPAAHLAYATSAVAFLVYGSGLALSFLLPEPQKDGLPE